MSKKNRNRKRQQATDGTSNILTRIARFIDRQIPNRSFGFATFIFPFNLDPDDPEARVNYVSNCERSSVADALSVWIVNQSVKEPDTPTLDQAAENPPVQRIHCPRCNSTGDEIRQLDQPWEAISQEKKEPVRLTEYQCPSCGSFWL